LDLNGFESQSLPIKKDHPFCVVKNLEADEGFDYQKGIDQFLNWSIKQSTGLFGFKWVRIPISANKKGHPFGWSKAWRRMRDSIIKKVLTSF